MLQLLAHGPVARVDGRLYTSEASTQHLEHGGPVLTTRGVEYARQCDALPTAVRLLVRPERADVVLVHVLQRRAGSVAVLEQLQEVGCERALYRAGSVEVRVELAPPSSRTASCTAARSSRVAISVAAAIAVVVIVTVAVVVTAAATGSSNCSTHRRGPCAAIKAT